MLEIYLILIINSLFYTHQSRHPCSITQDSEVQFRVDYWGIHTKLKKVRENINRKIPFLEEFDSNDVERQRNLNIKPRDIYVPEGDADTFLKSDPYLLLQKKYNHWKIEHTNRVNSLKIIYEEFSNKVKQWKNVRENLAFDRNLLDTTKSTLSSLFNNKGIGIYFYHECIMGDRVDVIPYQTTFKNYKENIMKEERVYDEFLLDTYNANMDKINKINNLEVIVNQKYATFHQDFNKLATNYYTKLKESINIETHEVSVSFTEKLIQTNENHLSTLVELDRKIKNNPELGEITSGLDRAISTCDSYNGYIVGDAAEKLVETIRKVREFVNLFTNFNANIKKVTDKLNELMSKINARIDAGRYVLTVFDDVLTVYPTYHAKLEQMLQQTITVECIKSFVVFELDLNKYELIFQDEFSPFAVAFELLHYSDKWDFNHDFQSLQNTYIKLQNTIITEKANYDNIKNEMNNSIDVKLPQIVKQTNTQHLDVNFPLEDPTTFLSTVKTRIDDLKSKLHTVISQNTTLIYELMSLRTSLDDLVLKNSKERTRYIDIEKSIQNYRSSPIRSIVQNGVNTFSLLEGTINKNLEEAKSNYNSLKTQFETIAYVLIDCQNQPVEFESDAQNILDTYNRMVAIKADLLKQVDLHPSEFNRLLSNKLQGFNLNSQKTSLSTDCDLLNVTLVSLSSKFEKLNSENNNMKLRLSQYLTDIGNLKNTITTELENINIKNTTVMKLFALANEKRDEVTKTIASILTASESVSKTSTETMLQLHTITETNLRMYEENKYVIGLEKQTAMDLFKNTKDFYLTKYLIDADEFDNKMIEISNKYDSLLSELLELKTRFSGTIKEVITQVEIFKADANFKYTTENTLLTNLDTLLQKCASRLMNSNTADSYSRITESCNNDIASVDQTRIRNNEFETSLVSILQGIKTLDITNVNYDNVMSKIENFKIITNQLMEDFENALRNKYRETEHRVSFEETKNEGLFNSLEQNYNDVMAKTLENLPKIQIAPYVLLIKMIFDIVEKSESYKKQYQKLNVDSIISKLFPELLYLKQDLSNKNQKLLHAKNTLILSYKKTDEIYVNFSKKKLSMQQMRNELTALIDLYKSKVEAIIKLSQDKLARGNNFDEHFKRLDDEKATTLVNIKKKLKQFMTIQTEIVNDSENYESLKNSITLLTNDLSKPELEINEQIIELDDECTKLKLFLDNITSLILKKVQIVGSLIEAETVLKEYNTDFFNRFEIQTQNIKTTIDLNVDLLVKARSTNAKKYTSLINKIASLSRHYTISSNYYTQDIHDIIEFEKGKLSDIESHCDKFITKSLSLNSEKLETLAEIRNLFTTEAAELSSTFAQNVATFECCQAKFNCLDCSSDIEKTLEECESYIIHSSTDKDEHNESVESLKSRFNSKLSQEQLNESNIFGIEKLKQLENNTLIIENSMVKLEEKLKREFKIKQLKYVRYKLAEIEQEVNVSKSIHEAQFRHLYISKSQLNLQIENYKNILSTHKNLGSQAKLEFLSLSKRATSMAKFFELTKKNNQTPEVISKLTTTAQTFETFGNKLNTDEEYIEKVYSSIEEINNEIARIYNNFESKKSSYYTLINDIKEVKASINRDGNDENLTEKGKLEETFHQYYSKLNNIFRELKTKEIILHQSNIDVSVIKKELKKRYNQSNIILKQFDERILDQQSHKQSLLIIILYCESLSIKILNVLEKSDKLGVRLANVKKSLAEKHRFAMAIIEEKKQALSILTKDLKLKLDEIKLVAVSKFLDYYTKFDEVFTKANKANLELSQDIIEKFSKNKRAEQDIRNHYFSMNIKIDENHLNGTRVYNSQEIQISNELFNMLSDCDRHLASLSSYSNNHKASNLDGKFNDTLLNVGIIITEIEKATIEKERYEFKIMEYSQRIQIKLHNINQHILADILALNSFKNNYFAVNKNISNSKNPQLKTITKLKNNKTVDAKVESVNFTNRHNLNIIISISSLALAALIITAVIHRYRPRKTF